MELDNVDQTLPIEAAANSNGLDVTSMDHYYMRGPKPLGYMYEGAAVNR